MEKILYIYTLVNILYMALNKTYSVAHYDSATKMIVARSSIDLLD